MKKSTLSLEMLRRVLDYDPLTGIFTWAHPFSRKVAVGEVAGTIAANGRRYIGILGEKHSAHRLAWFYHHGEWPTGNVRQAERGDLFPFCIAQVGAFTGAAQWRDGVYAVSDQAVDGVAQCREVKLLSVVAERGDGVADDAVECRGHLRVLRKKGKRANDQLRQSACTRRHCRA